MDKFEHIKNLDYPEYSINASHNIKKITLNLSLSEIEINKNLFLKATLFDLYKNINISYRHSQDNALKKQISSYTALEHENILITSGSDGALRIISNLFIDNNTRVCIPTPSFGRYEYHAKVNRGNIFFFNAKNFPYRFNLEGLEKFIKSKKIEVLFLANPNNPTGEFFNTDEMEDFIKKLDCIVILDESLMIDKEMSMASMVNKYKNLVITQSFSKLYGIAGARIGDILSHHENIMLLSKLTSPFEVTNFSIEMARLLLNNKMFINDRKESINKSLEMIKKFESMNKNFEVSPSSSLVVLIKYKTRENFYKMLLSEGILTVPGYEFRGIKGHNTVRISLRSQQIVRKFLNKLKKLE